MREKHVCATEIKKRVDIGEASGYLYRHSHTENMELSEHKTTTGKEANKAAGASSLSKAAHTPCDFVCRAHSQTACVRLIFSRVAIAAGALLLGAGAVAEAAGESFDVYETQIAAKTSVIKEVMLKINDLENPGGTRTVAIHYRAPATVKYTIHAARRGGDRVRDYEGEVYGVMWSASMRNAVAFEWEEPLGGLGGWGRPVGAGRPSTA